jgi:hypothetical protein
MRRKPALRLIVLPKSTFEAEIAKSVAEWLELGWIERLPDGRYRAVKPSQHQAKLKGI